MERHLLRCPNRHILGESSENGSVKVRHRGRTTVITPPYAGIRITCEQCGRTIDVLSDGRVDHPCTIKTDSQSHFFKGGET